MCRETEEKKEKKENNNIYRHLDQNPNGFVGAETR